MSLSEFESVVRPHIENELKQIVNGIGDDQFIGLRVCWLTILAGRGRSR